MDTCVCREIDASRGDFDSQKAIRRMTRNNDNGGSFFFLSIFSTATYLNQTTFLLRYVIWLDVLEDKVEWYLYTKEEEIEHTPMTRKGE